MSISSTSALVEASGIVEVDGEEQMPPVGAERPVDSDTREKVSHRPSHRSDDHRRSRSVGTIAYLGPDAVARWSGNEL